MVYGNQDRVKNEFGGYLHAHCQGRYVMHHHVGQTGHQQVYPHNIYVYIYVCVHLWF
jgi:hypothetical protein